MKFILIKLCLITFSFLFPLLVFSQKDVKKYKEEANAMRKDVWEWNKPEFAVRNIPAEYSNASKVVIARHIEINADSKKKAKLTMGGLGMYRQLMLTEIAREAVKINDKAALSDYSEIEFTQIEKRSGFFIDQTTMVYIGVRVIKGDGKVVEINADDIVLTKDEKRQKEAKLAIPDLQVGDIVDYFLAKQKNMEQLTTNTISSYAFSLYDDVPVLHYSIHCEFGKKYAIEYRLYNGAPDFKNTTTDQDDNVLDLVKKNIPAYAESNLWTSPYRQLPMIRMNVMVGYKGMFAGRLNAREPGKIYKDQNTAEFVEDLKNGIVEQRRYILKNVGTQYNMSFVVWDRFKDLKKNNKNRPLDSIMAEAYYLHRFSSFLDPYNFSKIETYIDLPKSGVEENANIYRYGGLLKEIDVDNQLVSITSRSGPEFKDIMGVGDINYMISAQGAKPIFFGVTDIFSPAFYVPYYFENTDKVITLDTKGPKNLNPKSFDQAFTKIPASNADQNLHIEKLDVAISPDAGNVQVNRRTLLKGHYKSNVQKQLILYEDYYETERKNLGLKKSMIEELQSEKRWKKFGEELKIAFDQARSKHKDAFVAEAKEWFEQEVIDMADHKVEELGIRHTNPDFIYSSKFKMGGLVKKAGNNLILEVGKLQGSPLKINSDQRKRTLDVYMPFARSIQFDINIEIPDGYTVEGVDALNKKVENGTGSFIAEATTTGKMIIIKAKKSYTHAFEPAANWEKLLAVIDAANDWGNSKILLKKK